MTRKKRRAGHIYALFRIDLRAALGLLLLALGAAAAITVSAMAAGTAGEGVEIPVVMYHALLKDEARHGKYVISPAEFEQDLLYLKEHGYTTILVEDLIAYTKGKDLPEKPVLLTFDDGYYNNYLYAFAIARQYKCKFVISPIGRYADSYSESGETNAYYTNATWEQLKEMHNSGLVEVQNHSYNLHGSGRPQGVERRAGEDESQYKARISADILKAQNAIEKHLGVAPTAFFYPFGAMSKGTPEIIKGLGFSATFTCREKISTITRDPESLYGLGRFLRESGISSQAFFEKRMGLA